jgi:hypothetical protein
MVLRARAFTGSMGNGGLYAVRSVPVVAGCF